MLAFGESACDDQETLELPKAPDLYVHQMLTQLRQEDIPQYYNARHVGTFKHDLVEAKPVFKEWKEDSPDVLAQVFKHDWDHMLITRIIDDEEQLRRIKFEIQNNLVMIKEIYRFL